MLYRYHYLDTSRLIHGPATNIILLRDFLANTASKRACIPAWNKLLCRPLQLLSRA